MSYSLLFCHCVGNIGEFSYSRNKLWIANSGYEQNLYENMNMNMKGRKYEDVKDKNRN